MINLSSDTQTRPSEDMRRAIATAEVGDEQRGQDPTTRRLEERVAELLGQEAALFLPSGTMCNVIGFRLHIRPGGDEAILAANSHPVNFEAGSPATLAQAMTRQIDTPSGILAPTSSRRRCGRPATVTSPARASCPWRTPRIRVAGACGRWRRSAACSASPSDMACARTSTAPG